MLLRTPFSIKDENGFYLGLTDEIFKAVYFSDDIELTKYFLSNILNKKIVSLNREANELFAETIFGKKHLLDALYTINNKIICNVEINTSYKSYINNRNFAFTARIYSDYTRRGEKYSNNKIFVHVDITCGLPQNYKNDIDYFKEQNEEKVQYIQNFVIIVKNVDKIMQHWYNRSDKKEYPFIDMYAYIMVMCLSECEIEELVNGPYLSKDNKEIIGKIGRKVIAMNNSSSWYTPFCGVEEKYLWFLHHESRELAKKEAKKIAKKMAKGMAENMAKSIAENMVKEEAEKLAKVEAQKLAKVEAEKLAKVEAQKLAKEKIKYTNDIIKRMLNLNFEPKVISESLNISIDDIEKIKLSMV